MVSIIVAIIGGIFSLLQVIVLVRLQQLHTMVNSQQTAQNIRSEDMAERTGRAEAELKASKK